MEDLKKLAEKMGIYYSTDEGVVFVLPESNPMQFDPLRNAEQALEVMEYFKINVQWQEGVISEWGAWDVKNGRKPYNISARGKTIQEAIVNTALEIIKQSDRG